MEELAMEELETLERLNTARDRGKINAEYLREDASIFGKELGARIAADAEFYAATANLMGKLLAAARLSMEQRAEIEKLARAMAAHHQRCLARRVYPRPTATES
jgi:hypothetical protein